MAPSFTFFVDKKDTQYAAPYIKKLDPYYPSFVDGEYVDPRNMKSRYAGANAKFFAFDCGEFIMFDLETVDLIEPLMAITMDTFTPMNRKSWLVIFKFLKAVFADQEPGDLLTDMLELVPVPTILVEKTQLLKSSEPPKELPQEYGFEHLVEDDIAYCEITKPFTDLPYTCVIRNYSEVGFEPLFTALYVSSSWGVTNMDYAFLEKLWVFLNMDGAIDLENRLKREIELCKLGKPEPEVYRLNIVDTKDQMSRKKKRGGRPSEPNKRYNV